MKLFDIILNLNSKNKCIVPELQSLSPSKSRDFKYDNLTYLKQRTIKKKEEKKITQIQSTSNLSETIIAHDYIVDPDFIKKTYYRIIEEICSYKLVFYYIVKLIYYNLLINHEDNIIKNKEKYLNTISVILEKLTNLLKQRNIDIENKAYPFFDLIKIIDNNNLIYYTKYAKKENIEVCENIEKQKYKKITVPLYSNNYHNLDEKFKFLIGDNYKMRYDTNYMLKNKLLDFNSSLAQPLEFFKHNTDLLLAPKNRCAVNFFRGQRKSTNVGIMYDDELTTPYLENTYPNSASKALKYSKNLYLPNFTKNKLDYSIGLLNNLDPNKTDFKYNKLLEIQPPADNGSILSLDEQIKQTELVIKTLNKNTARYYQQIYMITQNENGTIFDLLSKTHNASCLELLNNLKLDITSLGTEVIQSPFKFKLKNKIIIITNPNK